MKVLVTGASGFIGKSLVERLLAENHNVIGIVRQIKESTNSDNCRILSFDLREKGLPINEKEIDVLINLASMQPKDDSIRLESYYESNVKIVENLCQLAEEKKIKQFIHVSTTSVYRPNLNLERLTEDSTVDPQTPYGLTKHLGEEVLRIFSNSSRHDIQSCVLRFPSVFGRNQKGGLVDNFYSLAKKNEDIEIYNQGKSYRNLLYISDAVESIYKCLKIRGKLNKFETFVIGSLNSLNTLEIAKLIVSKLNSDSFIIPVRNESNKEGNILLDCSKAKTKLKFFPLTIEEGIDLYLKS